MNKQARSVHATENGLIMLYNAADGTAAMASSYGGEWQEISKEAMGFLYESLERAEDGLDEETRFTLENPNYEGRESNFPELRAAEISYSVDDAGTPFVRESISFETPQGFFEVYPKKNEETADPLTCGELQGRYEVFRSDTSDDIDPLTCGEAVWLLTEMKMAEGLEGLSPETIRRSCATLINPLIRRLAEKISDYIEAVDYHNWRARRWVQAEDGSFVTSNKKPVPRYFALHKLLPEGTPEQEKERLLGELVRRIMYTANRAEVGAPWSYSGRYTTTEREGVADITEELAVQGRSPQAQYLDCDLPDILNKEYEEKDRFLARAKNGEHSPSSLYRELFDEEGKNRGSSDRALYYYRCERERQGRFRKLLKAIHSLPVHLLIKSFGPEGELLKQKYRASVRRCSPGPARVREVDGRFRSVPLEGAAAVAVLVEKGFERSSLHPNVRFHRGNTWHKVLLRKEMMDELEKALDIRLKPYSQRLEERLKSKRPANANYIPPVVEEYMETPEY